MESKQIVRAIDNLTAGDWEQLKTILYLLAGEPETKEPPSPSSSP